MGCPVSSFCQDAKAVKAAPKPESAKSLELTAGEIKEKDALDTAIKNKQGELNEVLIGALTVQCPADQVCSEAILNSLILQKINRAREIYKADITQLNQIAADWLKRVQASHDCAGCRIEGNALLKPVEKPAK